MEHHQNTELLAPERWVDEHGDMLFRYAFSRLQNKDLAEEAVQETLYAAFQSKDSFAGHSSERAWLMGILKHKIVDIIRRKTRELPVDPQPDSDEEVNALFDQRGRWVEQPVAWGDDPEKVLEQKEFMQVFEECLSAVPSKAAQVFALYQMEGFKGEEICKALGITSTNLWVMLYRARMKLRDCLQKKWFHRP